MSRLLDGLDEILDDTFFDELMSLDIDEDDCSPTLNQFLGIQSKKDYDISLNEIYIKESEVKINIYSDMWCHWFLLLISYLVVYYNDLIKYTDKNDELLNRYYKKSLKVLV